MEGTPVPFIIVGMSRLYPFICTTKARKALDAIKQRREHALSGNYQIIDSMISLYRRHAISCLTPRFQFSGFAEACDAMVLGSLIKSAELEGVWPSLLKSHKGISFVSLEKKCKRLKVVALCDAVLDGKAGALVGFQYGESGHHFHQTLNSRIEYRKSSNLCGLSLADFEG